MEIPRKEIIRRLQAQVKAGKPIVGCGAGTGISAKFAEAGGADVIIIYNSGRYRMAGRGLAGGSAPLWGCQRHRGRNGGRGIARSKRHPGPGRRLRHGPFA